MSSFWGDILIHAAIFMGFLILFYFTFVMYVQRNSMANDIFGMTKDWIQEARIAGGPDVTQKIQTALSKVQPFPMSQKDADRNSRIAQIVSIFAGTMIPLMLIVGIWLEVRASASLYALFMETFIAMMFIVVSEFAIVGIFLANMTEMNKDTIEAILSEAMDSSSGLFAHCDFVDQFMKSRFPAFY